jgi:predicted transcriptional regulator
MIFFQRIRKYFIDNYWHDPVWSKVIAGIFLLIPSLISALIAKIKGVSFKVFFLQTITISIYQIIILLTILLFTILFLRWQFIKNKKKSMNVLNILEKEYEDFKTDTTFKHFDKIAENANSRLHFDNFDKDIVNYYVAKGILFDPQPGYGKYNLTNKGQDFFNRRSIEKVNKNMNKAKL